MAETRNSLANCKIANKNKQRPDQIAFAMTVVGHCTTVAYACVVRVNQPLSVRCFILVNPGFSIPAFNSGILTFSNIPGVW